jgi:hypothetical protein
MNLRGYVLMENLLKDMDNWKNYIRDTAPQKYWFHQPQSIIQTRSP